MPYYEVIVKASRVVCVKADNENDAEDLAHDKCLCGDWEIDNTEIEGEVHPEKDADVIKEYKADGQYFELKDEG